MSSEAVTGFFGAQCVCRACKPTWPSHPPGPRTLYTVSVAPEGLELRSRSLWSVPRCLLVAPYPPPPPYPALQRIHSAARNSPPHAPRGNSRKKITKSNQTHTPKYPRMKSLQNFHPLLYSIFIHTHTYPHLVLAVASYHLHYILHAGKGCLLSKSLRRRSR